MYFTYLSRNVWLLVLAQIFAFTGTNVTIFLGGIIGTKMAPSAALATMPVTLMIVGIACGSIPASRIMSRFGRRLGFIGAAVFASGCALVGALAIYLGDFWLYGLACFTLGLSIAFVQQYRFTAGESVAKEYAPQAISAILLAGIAGAFLGPNIANATKDLTDVPFVGSYLALAVLVLMPAFILIGLTDSKVSPAKQSVAGRSLQAIAQQRTFILAIMSASLGYAIMAFLMTATPISMHVMDGHSVYHTGVVIQWHIVGMFLPSIFTGKLIRKYGHERIIVVGIAAFLVCIGVSQLSQSVTGYWIALVGLGVGWNFLFVAGTTLLITCYQDEEKFRVQGVNDFIVFSLQAAGSLSAGWLLALSSWKTINLMTIPLLLLLLLVMWWSQSGKPDSGANNNA